MTAEYHFLTRYVIDVCDIELLSRASDRCTMTLPLT